VPHIATEMATGGQLSAASANGILVVVDEPLLGLVLEWGLAEVGALVVGPARSFAQCKRLIEDAHIDAGLLDAKLIGVDFNEVAAMLTQRNVPFAVLTAYVGEPIPAACRAAPTLAKPFTEQQLIATVRRLLDRA